MTIVNPYLRKTKRPVVVGGGASKTTITSTNTNLHTPTTKPKANPKANPKATAISTLKPAMTITPSRTPSRVPTMTPKPKPMAVAATAGKPPITPNAFPNATASRTVVTPNHKHNNKNNNNNNGGSFPKKAQLLPVHRQPRLLALAKASVHRKAPTTLKQQLKQQIQSLKKRKVSVQRVKLDQQRRIVQEQQRREKEAQRILLQNQREQEKLQKQKLREQILAEKEAAKKEKQRLREIEQQKRQQLKLEQQRLKEEARKAKEEARKAKEEAKQKQRQEEHHRWLQQHQQWMLDKQAWLRMRQAYYYQLQQYQQYQQHQKLQLQRQQLQQQQLQLQQGSTPVLAPTPPPYHPTTQTATVTATPTPPPPTTMASATTSAALGSAMTPNNLPPSSSSLSAGSSPPLSASANNPNTDSSSTALPTVTAMAPAPAWTNKPLLVQPQPQSQPQSQPQPQTQQGFATTTMPPPPPPTPTTTMSTTTTTTVTTTTTMPQPSPGGVATTMVQEPSNHQDGTLTTPLPSAVGPNNRGSSSPPLPVPATATATLNPTVHQPLPPVATTTAAAGVQPSLVSAPTNATTSQASTPWNAPLPTNALVVPPPVPSMVPSSFGKIPALPPFHRLPNWRTNPSHGSFANTTMMKTSTMTGVPHPPPRPIWSLPPCPQPPPMPAFLRPQRQRRPRIQKAPPMARLCDPSLSQAPFCRTHDTNELIAVVLVRRLDRNETSFGVNLKSFQTSGLVDPEWWLEQQQRQRQLQQRKSSSSTTQSTPTATPKDDSKVGQESKPAEATQTPESSIEKSTAEVAAQSPPSSVVADGDKIAIPEENVPTKQENLDEAPEQVQNENVAEIHAISPSSESGGTNDGKENKDPSSPSQTSETLRSAETTNETVDTNGTEKASTMVAIPTTSNGPVQQEASTNGSNSPSPESQSAPASCSHDEDEDQTNLSPATSAAAAAATAAPNTNTTEKNNSLSNTSSIPASVPSTTTTEVKADSDMLEHDQKGDKPPSVATPVSTALVGAAPAAPVAPVAPKRRRRRRVNFTVMMIVDAEKHNERRPKDSEEHLLQPGDIIVSIGGTPIAGMTFAEACAIFTTKSEKQGDSEIHAKLLVARRRAPKPKVVISSSTIKAAPKQSASTNASSTALTTVAVKSADLPDAAPKSMVEPTGPSPTPMKVLSLLPANASMNFGPNEIAVLTDSFFHAIHHPTRLLGQSISEAILDQTTGIFRQVAALKDCSLAHRSVETLRSKWTQLTRSIDLAFAERARDFWSKTLQEESGKDEDATDLPFSCDSDRSLLRQMPRPPKGCRCKSHDHEYLHDAKCSLYRDLRRRLSEDELSELLQTATATTKNNKKGIKDLNVVETAFKDRMVKLKTAAEMEATEARFVARMEEIQVKECKKAVFAPNLSTIVLSTILELQREFPINEMDAPEEMDVEEESDDEDEDDDGMDEENVPLMALGKRRTDEGVARDGKKHKTSHQNRISPKYLARMLQYISKTWGHVYREPSHEEYAWRWEVYHGHNSENVQWGSRSTNPRTPNSLPFENTRFGQFLPEKNLQFSELSAKVSEFHRGVQETIFELSKPSVTEPAIPTKTASSIPCNVPSNAAIKVDDDHDSKDKVASKDSDDSLKKKEPKSTKCSRSISLDVSKEDVEQYCLATHLLSPSNSGVYDEILAFVQMGVLEISGSSSSSSGIPLLSKDWSSKVDVVLLEDMDASWGTDSDPEGRCCVHDELRDTLEEEWIKSEHGWALADDPKDLIFDFGVLDEWRQTFEGQLEERANYSEGIGRFGL